MKEYLLKEIANVKNGYAFDSSKYSDKGIPIIRIADIKDNIDLSKCVCIDEEINKEFLIKKGSLLIALSGATTGKMSVFSDNKIAYLNQRICSIYTKNEDISQEFLIYFLKSIQKKIIVNSYGGAQPNISSKWIENIKIKVPNIEIQKKISKKLELLANSINSRKSQLVFLKELIKSLFIKFFGNPEYNEKGWSFSSLKDISLCKGEYGSNKPAINYNGGYRYIRITDITTNGELKEDKVGVHDEEIEAQKYLLKENDILFARSGATVGKNFFYNKKYGKCIFAGYLIRFQLNTHLVSTTYLKKFLETNYYWNWVKNCQNIVAQPNINAKQYGEDLKIMLPPIKLQNKFSKIIEKIEKLSFNFY
jgi:putative type I restriction-modification system, S subunit